MRPPLTYLKNQKWDGFRSLAPRASAFFRARGRLVGKFGRSDYLRGAAGPCFGLAPQPRKPMSALAKFDQLESALAQASAVEHLDLSGQPIEALPPEMGKMTRLKILDITGTRVADLGPIWGIEGLAVLRCKGAPLPKAQLEAFQELRPDCQVQSDAPKKAQPSGPSLALVGRNMLSILLLTAATYLAMRWITPTTHSADGFLLGFALGLYGLALLASGIVLLAKALAGRRA